jgi:hypothetical protein
VQALSLDQVVGQFLVHPVGPIPPLLGWPRDHPAADLVGQRDRDPGGRPLGRARSQALQAPFVVDLEPACDGPAVDAEILGAVLTPATAMSPEDDLKMVAELAVIAGTEPVFQALEFLVGEWNANQGCFLPSKSEHLLSL